MESLVAPRLVSATARRHGISRFQLLAWRRALKVEGVGGKPGPAFVPAVLAPEPIATPEPVLRRRPARASAPGRMVIEVGCGRRVVVDGAVDVETLARVLDVLDRR